MKYTKKTFIIRGVFWGIIIAILCAGYGIVKHTQRKAEFTKHELSNDFIPLFSINDSSLFIFPTSKRVMLLYFHSGCEHCQKEFKEIEKSKGRFSAIEVVFFSHENIKAIKDFVNQHDFINQNNFHFTKINPEHLNKIFGNIPQPTFFIYNNGKLTQELRGEKTIGEILKYLK